MVRILVPRLIDAYTRKAQDINAIYMLKNFSFENGFKYTCFYYKNPHTDFQDNEFVELKRIISMPPSVKRGFWLTRKISRKSYQIEYSMKLLKRSDSIFYPSGKYMNSAFLKARKYIDRNVKIISTLEGFLGTREMERDFTEYLGRKVVFAKYTKKPFMLQEISDRVVVISDLLRVFLKRYAGIEADVMPLGIDDDLFFVDEETKKKNIVISVGRVSPLKRPDMFVKIASGIPDHDFVWYGEGPMRPVVSKMVREKGIRNVHFPGAIGQKELADKLREASIYVHPSISESWSKAAQEAQACGLPVVMFGYYDSPIAKHGRNALVAWSDEEFEEYVRELCRNSRLREQIGSQAAKDAACLSWKNVAPMWEKYIENAS